MGYYVDFTVTRKIGVDIIVEAIVSAIDYQYFYLRGSCAFLTEKFWNDLQDSLDNEIANSDVGFEFFDPIYLWIKEHSKDKWFTDLIDEYCELALSKGESVRICYYLIHKYNHIVAEALGD